MSAAERPRHTGGCEPCPRPAETTARCATCTRDYTPARAPHGCPFCWVSGMADRIFAGHARRPELRVVATAPLEPKPGEPATERVRVDGFEQEPHDDSDLPF